MTSLVGLKFAWLESGTVGLDSIIFTTFLLDVYGAYLCSKFASPKESCGIVSELKLVARVLGIKTELSRLQCTPTTTRLLHTVASDQRLDTDSLPCCKYLLV